MSVREWITRPALVGEGPEIAGMLKQVQSPITLPITIWSSPKAGAYVDHLIAGDDEHRRARFYVMAAGSNINGVISMRWVDQCVFSDNAFLSRELRSMQLGAVFVGESVLSYWTEFKAPSIAFDVYASERVLHSWYRRLGGKEQFRRSWWEIELKPDADGYGVLSGWETAEQQIDRWGFGRVTVHTRLATYEVGCLPGAFRVTDHRAASDPGLHRVLRTLDGSRKLFLLTSSGSESIPGREVAVSIRMKADLMGFIEATYSHVPKRRFDYATANASAG